MCKKQAKKALKSAQKLSLGSKVVANVAKDTGSPELQAVLNPTVFAVSGRAKAEKNAKFEAARKADEAQRKIDQDASDARAGEAGRLNQEAIQRKRKRKSSSLLATAGGGSGLGSALSTYGKSSLGE